MVRSTEVSICMRCPTLSCILLCQKLCPLCSIFSFFLAFCTLFLVCQRSNCVHAMDGHAQHILTKWSWVSHILYVIRFAYLFLYGVSFIRLMHIYPNNNNQKRKITKMDWRYHWYSKCWWWEMKNVRKKTRFFIVNTCALKLIHAQLSCFHVYFCFLNKCPGIISFITW